MPLFSFTLNALLSIETQYIRKLLPPSKVMKIPAKTQMFASEIFRVGSELMVSAEVLLCSEYKKITAHIRING